MNTSQYYHCVPCPKYHPMCMNLTSIPEYILTADELTLFGSRYLLYTLTDTAPEYDTDKFSRILRVITELFRLLYCKNTHIQDRIRIQYGYLRAPKGNYGFLWGYTL